jgi:hypothetical protein
MAEWFWKRLTLFAWRRWVVGKPEPVEVPGRRDPECPCQGCCHHAVREEEAVV